MITKIWTYSIATTDIFRKFINKIIKQLIDEVKLTVT